nr:hypothetical protein [Alicyclobacillus macrosporangiidus]
MLAFASDPMQTARLLATLDEAATLALWAQAVGGAKSPPRRPMRRLNPV